MGSIRVVRGRDIPDVTGDVSSESWTRRLIEVNDLVTINEARNAPGAISAWHHHGENTGYVHVRRGRVRIEWGPGGRETAELGQGDFYVVAPNTIHRESNPGSEDQVLVAWVVGSGPMFVDADGPEAS